MQKTTNMLGEILNSILLSFPYGFLPFEISPPENPGCFAQKPMLLSPIPSMNASDLKQHAFGLTIKNYHFPKGKEYMNKESLFVFLFSLAEKKPLKH